MTDIAERGSVLIANTTKRRFSAELKREAVALWETRGRPQTEISAEVSIVPAMPLAGSASTRRAGLACEPNGEIARIYYGVASGSGVRDCPAASRAELSADGARRPRRTVSIFAGDAALTFAFIQHASTWPLSVLRRMFGTSRGRYVPLPEDAGEIVGAIETAAEHGEIGEPRLPRQQLGEGPAAAAGLAPQGERQARARAGSLSGSSRAAPD